MKNITNIAFDADDTLWINETYFQETEAEFCALLADYMSAREVSGELYKTESANNAIYGYGVKGFALSMIETALRVSQNRLEPRLISKIIDMEKSLLQKPVVLLDGVREVLEKLGGRYRLVVATKGDISSQERKLEESGLLGYFHHIEIMSYKGEKNYKKLLGHLDCAPENFLMVGNSYKSDIEPVLALGGWGAYVPFYVTWQYEKVENENLSRPRLIVLEKITDILKYL